MNNMQIWDSVSKTNPANTKKVNQRGGFTSICAQSQIMEATRQFGPIGHGWGYINGDPIFHETIVLVPVTIWHGDRANTYGPLFGGAEWKDTKGRIDNDAAKKAGTDGLTKGLSQLGFNADVFLGLYDDNKYVAKVAAEFSAQESNLSDSDGMMLDAIAKCQSIEDLSKWSEMHGQAAGMSDNARRIRAAYKSRMQEINTPKEKAA